MIKSITNDLGMKFNLIPSGSITKGKYVCRLDDFFIQETVVTNGQYGKYYLAKNLPVINVSYNDAINFISKLNSVQNDLIYSLPTEMQWECACGTAIEKSDNFNDYVWHHGNSKGSINPVAKKKLNKFGLYDMLGNVLEWCSDWYSEYPEGFFIDYKGPSSGYNRVVRGGSWDFHADYCRSASRYWNSPINRSVNLGFRLTVKLNKE